MFLAAGTPIPFKLMTITAGFVEMNLVTFTLAAIAGRALIFMIVGILFQLFGAPIKAIIDKYLGTVTTVFVVLVVAGFVAITQFGGGEDEGEEGPCANVTSMEQLTGGE